MRQGSRKVGSIPLRINPRKKENNGWFTAFRKPVSCPCYRPRSRILDWTSSQGTNENGSATSASTLGLSLWLNPSYMHSKDNPSIRSINPPPAILSSTRRRTQQGGMTETYGHSQRWFEPQTREYFLETSHREPPLQCFHRFYLFVHHFSREHFAWRMARLDWTHYKLSTPGACSQRSALSFPLPDKFSSSPSTIFSCVLVLSDALKVIYHSILY